ncbi:MFS transporter [Pseudomonadota bacterium]
MNKIIKNKELNNFITKFYLFKLFEIMGFIIPFVAVMFDANGLTATQIAICMMSARIVQTITEIPSGAIADKYSRKYVLVVSQLFAVFAYIFWYFMPYFNGYLLGYICFGLGMSLSSGTVQAFIYDELVKFQSRDLFERVQGRAGALTSVGILIASLIASVLIKLGLDFQDLILLTILTTIVSISILLTIKPAKKQKDVDEPENVLSYMQTLKEGIKYSFSHKTVFKLILFVTFTDFINIGILEYSEIFYNEVLDNFSKVAIAFGLVEIAFIVGNFFAEYLKRFSTRELIVLYCIAACFDVLAYTIYNKFSILIVIANSMIICCIFVNMLGRINNFIPEKIRATTLSVKGFIESVGTFITLVCFGFVVDYYSSYRIGFLTFAYIYIIGSFVFLILLSRDKEIKNS